MKTLRIPFCGTLNFSQCAVAQIETYRWRDNGYTPQAQAELCYNEEAIAVRMSAQEPAPRATVQEDGGAVWTDSCLEFFLRPESDPRYLNFEMNPLGKAILAFGDKPNPGRAMLIDQYSTMISVQPLQDDRGWSVCFVIPFAMLRQIYGDIDFTNLRANFYKCGDHTEFPHFGMWNEIIHNGPLFHLPEFFGKLILDQNP